MDVSKSREIIGESYEKSKEILWNVRSIQKLRTCNYVG
jgi:hypothetical protein